MLLLNHTIQELMAGQGQLTGASARAALGVGTPVAIGPGSPAELPTAGGDSGVIDAEIIEPAAVTVAELWHQMSDDQRAAARTQQQEAGLPPKIGDMDQAQAQQFIDILKNNL